MKLEIYKSQRIHDGTYTRYNPIQPCMLNKILPGIKKKIRRRNYYQHIGRGEKVTSHLDHNS